MPDTVGLLPLASWLRWQRICLQCRRPRLSLWVGKIPWRTKWLPTQMARRIPRMEEPGRWQSMGSQRVGHDWATNTFTFLSFHFISLSFPFIRTGSLCPNYISFIILSVYKSPSLFFFFGPSISARRPKAPLLIVLTFLFILNQLSHF